jgi:hypothetical protein
MKARQGREQISTNPSYPNPRMWGLYILGLEKWGLAGKGYREQTENIIKTHLNRHTDSLSIGPDRKFEERKGYYVVEVSSQ